jgi:hypothetical protein
MGSRVRVPSIPLRKIKALLKSKAFSVYGFSTYCLPYLLKVIIAASELIKLAETDASYILKADLKHLQAEITRSLPKAKDAMTVYHLTDMQSRIKDLLTTKKS